MRMPLVQEIYYVSALVWLADVSWVGWNTMASANCAVAPVQRCTVSRGERLRSLLTADTPSNISTMSLPLQPYTAGTDLKEGWVTVESFVGCTVPLCCTAANATN